MLSQVSDHAIFFITIAALPRGKNRLCYDDRMGTLFDATDFNRRHGIWWPHLVLLMPDHLLRKAHHSRYNAVHGARATVAKRNRSRLRMISPRKNTRNAKHYSLMGRCPSLCLDILLDLLLLLAEFMANWVRNTERVFHPVFCVAAIAADIYPAAFAAP